MSLTNYALLPFVEHDQITRADIPLSIQQKLSLSEGASCVLPLMDKIHGNRIPPCARLLHMESSSSFSAPPSSSSMGVVKKPLPLAKHLMHKNSTTSLSETKAITTEHPAITNMSGLLQNFTNSHQFPVITFPYSNSDSNVSLLHIKHPLQDSLPRNVVNTAVSRASHSDTTAKPTHFNSISPPDDEEIYDDISNVVSPKHNKGWVTINL